MEQTRREQAGVFQGEHQHIQLQQRRFPYCGRDKADFREGPSLSSQQEDVQHQSARHRRSSKVGPFVKTAECYKTKNGHINISITQRMPIIRIKSNCGADFYLDDNGGILPNSKYTSDLIIATGNIDNDFARLYIAPLAKAISDSPLWLNQIEQINVLPDRGIELVPRVGDHIIFIGHLPQNTGPWTRKHEIAIFVTKKLSRLEKFYRYGLSQAGWNKYAYIDIEFDNQIICKRRDAKAEEAEEKELTKEEKAGTSENRQRTEKEEREKARKEVERQEHAADGPTE